MEQMTPRERAILTLEGKPVDRVPCFCAMVESRTAHEILGKPPVSYEFMIGNPLSRWAMDHFPEPLTRPFSRAILARTLNARNVAQAVSGFDAIWAFFDDSWRVLDSKTLALTTGSFFKIVPDGFGNMTYMYREPGIQTAEDFDAWHYWPDADDVGQRTFRYYRKFIAKYGERVCVCANGFFGGLHESMNWTFGIDKAPLWIRRRPDYVKRYLDMLEKVMMAANGAMLDAGVPVVLQTDDFAFKTGPFLSPKTVEEVFGERYRRIIKYVHDRGAKYILHSCGDNTRLFDTFLSWGVDGLHAYETTSNVDIFAEKLNHGEHVTMIGGVGIDYLLTERSRDEEIVERVKELIARLGPGGRFMVSPVHSEDSMPAQKLMVMLDAVKKYGSYPLAVE